MPLEEVKPKASGSGKSGVAQNGASDEELIRAFQEGSQAAFDELVRRYKGLLFNFIVRIVGDPAFSEDLLQETFIRLWTNRDSYREIAKFSTWIYTVAANLARTELRRKKMRRWLSLSGGSDFSDRPLDIADETADPHHDLERSIIQRRVEEEIARLPLVFREAIILRDVQELTYEEISSILDIPLGTVKSRVNRGRRRLQRRLKNLL